MSLRRVSCRFWPSLLLLLALGAPGYAQQPGIATRFEIIEYDCSAASSVEACNAALQNTVETSGDWSKLDSSVPGRTLISLEQVLLPDVPAVQRVEFDDSRLDLELSASAPQDGASLLAVSFDFDRGGDISAGSTSALLRLGERPQVVGLVYASPGGGAAYTMVFLLSADKP